MLLDSNSGRIGICGTSTPSDANSKDIPVNLNQSQLLCHAKEDHLYLLICLNELMLMDAHGL